MAAEDPLDILLPIIEGGDIAICHDTVKELLILSRYSSNCFFPLIFYQLGHEKMHRVLAIIMENRSGCRNHAEVMTPELRSAKA
ncbi:MAG: hypothetical protein H6Q04_2260 [Acidobacteria bacterium]|nr:hypothetical protein [Acidobacteriota bacterium]